MNLALEQEEAVSADSFPKASAANIERMLRNLNHFNSTPEFGTTRVLFTEPEVAAREYIKREMKQLGLKIREDAAGNIFGTYEGTEPVLAPVWTGSHIDTVLNAGMFDGMSGVVAGLEAVRLFEEAGLRPRRSVVVVVYTSEEPTRFGLGCLGSRALAGKLGAAEAKELKDKDGNSLYDVLKSLGFPVEHFDEVPVRRGDVKAAVELHIDQTGELERAGKTLGVVKTICAPSVYDFKVTGRQSHAGGTSMARRRDAFMASAEMALAAERLTKESFGKDDYATATIGRVNVIPGAVNVIPGEADFSLDVRDASFEHKKELTQKILAEFEEIAKKREVTLDSKMYNDDHPMPCQDDIQKKLVEAAEETGISYIKTISGAFHDSMLVGEFAPVGMLFVPSRDGISHSPQEWTDFADIAAGTDVLARALFALADE